jgi:hypothetical protein
MNRYPAVGLRYGKPPRHLDQLKTRAISLIAPGYVAHMSDMAKPGAIKDRILTFIQLM